MDAEKHQILPFMLFSSALPKMDIKELTQEMHRFVAAKGWYKPDSPRQQTPRNLAISLVLEAAEVLDHFQWGDRPAQTDKLAGELADVALYLMQIASISGIDLERAILDKLTLNYDRTWDDPPGDPDPEP